MGLLRPVLLVCVCLCLSLSSVAQTEMASLQRGLLWQRTSPTPQQLDGPVLYTIIMRSSATPGNIPKISSNYTLANSLITDTGTTVMIGGANGLVVNGSSGIITFAPGQTLPTGQFLALTGGALSGDLNGVNATFSGNVTSLAPGIFTGDGSGLSNVNAAQLGGQLPGFYQQRVGGNCPPGAGMAGVNADGTVVCNPNLPQYFNGVNLRTVLDSTPGAGFSSSITIGTDGLPIISYAGANSFNSNLSVVQCTAVNCSTHGAVTVLDSTVGAGAFSSITIGTDGLPIISYAGYNGNNTLSVVHCTAVDCSTHGAVTVLDSTPNAGQYTSITMGTDGLPIISYRGAANLSAVHCTALDCSTHGAVTVLDSAPGAGSYSSITMGTDGLPIISYTGTSGPNNNLSVVRCTVADCSTHGAVTVLDGTPNAGQFTSMTIGADGLPIISYQGLSSGFSNLSVVHCTAVDCSTHGAVTVPDSTPNAGQYTSITIGPDGLPIISYLGVSGGIDQLSVVHCTAVDCSTHGVVTVLGAGMGQPSSITIGTDEVPIISYTGISSGFSNLSAAHCANLLCVPPFVRRR